MDKTVGNRQNSPKDLDQYYNEQIMEQEKRSHELAAIPVGGALIKKFAFLILITAVVAYAQTPASRNSKSDEDKIASALQPSRKFVTNGATVLDYPTSAGGEFRVLRAGTNEWTYLPGAPGATHDEPGCFDQVFLQILKDSMAGRTPNLQSVGISYMCASKWIPNKLHAMGSGDAFHVGPHIMILGLDQKTLQTFNQDGSTGEPYANYLDGPHSEPFLVLPIRQWDDTQAARSVGALKR